MDSRLNPTAIILISRLLLIRKHSSFIKISNSFMYKHFDSAETFRHFASITMTILWTYTIIPQVKSRFALLSNTLSSVPPLVIPRPINNTIPYLWDYVGLDEPSYTQLVYYKSSIQWILPGAYCIKLLPEKKTGYINQSFFSYGKVNGKTANPNFWILPEFFSQVKLLCNRSLGSIK